MKLKKKTKIKIISLGIVGAFAGVIPNIFLKSFPIIFTFGFGNIYPISILGISLYITPFGFISAFGLETFFLFFPLVTGGALFGYLGAYTGYLISFKSGYIDFGEWAETSFWSSFLGGVVFNLIFILYVPIIAS